MRPKKQEWLRKLRNTIVMTAQEAAKYCPVALAAQLKSFNSENEARNINSLFSTDGWHIQETEKFWEGIWEKDVNNNDKTMWIAELKANHQVSVIQQQPMKDL